MTIFNIMGTFGTRGYGTMTQMGEVEVQLGRAVDPTDVAIRTLLNILKGEEGTTEYVPSEA